MITEYITSFDMRSMKRVIKFTDGKVRGEAYFSDRELAYAFDAEHLRGALLLAYAETRQRHDTWFNEFLGD